MFCLIFLFFLAPTLTFYLFKCFCIYKFKSLRRSFHICFMDNYLTLFHLQFLYASFLFHFLINLVRYLSILLAFLMAIFYVFKMFSFHWFLLFLTFSFFFCCSLTYWNQWWIYSNHFSFSNMFKNLNRLLGATLVLSPNFCVQYHSLLNLSSIFNVSHNFPSNQSIFNCLLFPPDLENFSYHFAI